jgi:hypothetical protein
LLRLWPETAEANRLVSFCVRFVKTTCRGVTSTVLSHIGQLAWRALQRWIHACRGKKVHSFLNPIPVFFADKDGVRRRFGDQYRFMIGTVSSSR